MRKILTAFTLLSFATLANATVYSTNGQVQAIYAKDRINYTADSASIVGFSSAGSCATSNGLITIAMRDDEGGKRQFSVFLAAKLAGVAVSVQLDDSQKTPGGSCYLQLLTM